MTQPLALDRRGLMLVVLTSALYGIYPSAARAVYADGGNFVFMMIATIWARAAGLTGYCLLKRKPMFRSREDIRQALIGGVLQAYSAFTVMLALTMIPGPLVIMAVFSYTLMLLFYLVWKGEAKLDALTLPTTVLALIGLSLVLDVWHRQSMTYIWGIAISLSSAVAIALRMYVYGTQTRQRHPAVVGAENFLVAATVTCCAVLYRMPQLPVSAASFAWTALACVTMAAGTFIMFFGISKSGSFLWSLFSKLEPVFTALFSAILIHEVLKPSQYVGMAVVLGALVVYQFGAAKRQMKA